MDALVFDIDLQEQPVIVKRKDGTVKNYVLRELTGKQKGQYLNGMNTRLSISEDGKVTGIKNFDGIETSLLCRCLYNEEGKLVSESELQELPARVLKQLFDAAQTLSGLNKEGTDKAKNE